MTLQGQKQKVRYVVPAQANPGVDRRQSPYKVVLSTVVDGHWVSTGGRKTTDIPDNVPGCHERRQPVAATVVQLPVFIRARGARRSGVVA